MLQSRLKYVSRFSMRFELSRDDLSCSWLAARLRGRVILGDAGRGCFFESGHHGCSLVVAARMFSTSLAAKRHRQSESEGRRLAKQKVFLGKFRCAFFIDFLILNNRAVSLIKNSDLKLKWRQHQALVGRLLRQSDPAHSQLLLVRHSQS